MIKMHLHNEGNPVQVPKSNWPNNIANIVRGRLSHQVIPSSSASKPFSLLIISVTTLSFTKKALFSSTMLTLAQHLHTLYIQSSDITKQNIVPVGGRSKRYFPKKNNSINKTSSFKIQRNLLK